MLHLHLHIQWIAFHSLNHWRHITANSTIWWWAHPRAYLWSSPSVLRLFMSTPHHNNQLYIPTVLSHPSLGLADLLISDSVWVWLSHQNSIWNATQFIYQTILSTFPILIRENMFRPLPHWYHKIYFPLNKWISNKTHSKNSSYCLSNSQCFQSSLSSHCLQWPSSY